jgi:hypothetical protein
MDQTLPYPAQGASGLPGSYRSQHDASHAATGALLSDEASQRLLAEVRRDMTQQIDWQVQQHLAARRGPSVGEAVLALGSLGAGAGVTAVLVSHATVLSWGLWGTQSVSHMDILPYVALVWLAVIVVNLIWARRR